MCMKVSGCSTKQAEKVLTSIQMAQSSPVRGAMINRMDMELKHGQMELATRDTTVTE